MGKLYVPPKARTSLDHIRRDLDQAERSVTHLDDPGSDPLQVLRLFDRIERGLNELEEEGADVRAERTRFETVQRQLKSHQGHVVSQLAGALEEAREKHEPAPSRWWWFLDRRASRRRRRRWLRAGSVVALLAVVLAGAWLAYTQFLAPPAHVRRAFRYKEAAKSSTDSGELEAALKAVNIATSLTPDDAEAWLWKGALHERLGQAMAADESFSTARSLYDKRLDFLLERGRVFLQLGDLERATADAESAIAMTHASGWGYYLRAGVNVQRGDYTAALDDLEQAAELSNQAGDARLQAMIGVQRAQLMRMQVVPTPE